MKIDIGVGEYAVCDHAGTELKTFALGTCVAVIATDPTVTISGLVHIQLPDSSIDPDKSIVSPGLFADTGIPKLLSEMRKFGCRKYSNIKIKLVGGANLSTVNSIFNIGQRNILSAKKVLWRFGLGAIAEDIGGSISRTVSLKVGSMDIYVSNGTDTWKI